MENQNPGGSLPTLGNLTIAELQHLISSLQTQLDDLLLNADVKEEKLDSEIAAIDDNDGSIDSASEEFNNLILNAKTVSDKKLKVQEEIQRRLQPIQQSPIPQEKQSEEQKLDILKQDFQKLMNSEEIKTIEELNERIQEKQEELADAKERNLKVDIEEASQSLNILNTISKMHHDIIKTLEEILKEGRLDLSLLEVEEEEGDVEKEREKLEKKYKIQMTSRPALAAETKVLLDLANKIIKYQIELKSFKQVKKSNKEEIDEILKKFGLNNKVEFDKYLVLTQNKFDRAKSSNEKDSLKKRLNELNVVLEYYNKQESDIDAQTSESIKDPKIIQMPFTQTLADSSVEIPLEDIKKEQQLATAHTYAQGVSRMQDCFEKSFFTLIYYVCLQNFSKEDKIYGERDIFFKIKELAGKLQNMIKDENILDKSVKTIVVLANSSDSFDHLIELAFSTLNKIKPFSFQELFSLMKEVDKSGDAMIDQDIIMLLGTTGSGKSTTVHYLAGSKMRLVKVNKIPHIEPDPEFIFNRDLKKVISSWKAKSETRYVTPVSICHKSRNIIIADTPGSEDTQSAEIEFANMLGVNNSIGRAKSVRPVILFSYKNVGNRMEKLKDLMHYYSQLFKRIDVYVQNFTYIFTNVTDGDTGTKGTILSQLINIRTQLTSHEQNDGALNTMLNDMIKKANEGKIIEINPLDPKQREIILDQIILETSSIPYPGEVICPNVSSSSHAKLKQQLAIHEQDIKNSLLLGRGDIIMFKLDEIKKLIELFPESPSYQNKLEEYIKIIQKFIESRYENATNLIAQCFQLRALFTQEHASNYFKEYNYMKKFDECALFCSNDMKIKQSADYITALNLITSKILSELKYSEIKICDKAWFDFIKKIHLLSQFEKLQITEQKVINEFMLRVKKSSDYCLKLLQENQIISLEISQKQDAMQITQSLNLSLINDQEYFEADQSEQISSRKIKPKRKMSGESILSETSNSNDQIYQYEFTYFLVQIQKAKTKMSKINITDSTQKLISLLEEIKSKFTEFIKKQIKQAFQDYEDQSKLSNISQNKVNQGQKTIESFIIFRNAFQNYKLNEFEKILTDITNNLQEQLEKTMDKFISYFQEILEKQEKPDDIEKMYQNLKIFQQITLLQTPQINTKFYSLINSISNYVRSLDDKIAKIFEEIHLKGKIDYTQLQKLKKLLFNLKQLEWFDQVNKQSLKDSLENIESNFTQYIQQIRIELDGKEFDLNNLENLLLLAKAQSQIKDYQEILKITNIDKISQDQIDFEGKYSLIKQIIQSYQITLADIQKIENPLEIKELKFLVDYSNYLAVLNLNSLVFGKENNYQTIIQNIKCILDSQYKIIIDKLKEIENYIEKYCNLQLVQQNHNEVSEKLEILHTILHTLQEISKNYPNILKKINPLSDNLISSKQYESWKEKMIQNPTENIAILRQMLAGQDYYEVNEKIKQIQLMANLNEFNNALILIRDEIKLHQTVLDQASKFDESVLESLIFNKLKSGKALIDLEKHIDAKYLPTNLSIKQKIDNFISQISSLAREQIARSQMFNKLKNYSNSFKCLNVATIILEGLRKSGIIDEKVIDVLEQTIGTEKKTQIENLRKEVEAYKELDFFQLLYKPPKQIYENLLKIEDEGLSLAFQISLKENVMGKLQTELSEVVALLEDENADTGEMAKKLQKIEMVKDAIPGEWWADLPLLIVKNDIERRIEQENQMIDKIMENNDIALFAEFIEKKSSRILKNNKKNSTWFNEQMQQEIEKCTNLFDTYATVPQGIGNLIKIDNKLNNKHISGSIEKKTSEELNKATRKVFDIVTQCTQDLQKLFDEQTQLRIILSAQENPSCLPNSFEQLKSFEQAVINMALLIEAIKENDDNNEQNRIKNFYQQLKNSLNNNLEKINQSADKYIRKLKDRIFNNTKDGKLQIESSDCQKAICLLYRVDLALSEIRKEKLTSYINLGLTNEFLNNDSSLFNEQILKISDIMNQICQKLNGVELITEQTILIENDRKVHFCEIQAMLIAIEIIINFGEGIYRQLPQDPKMLKQKFELHVKAKITQIIEQLHLFIQKSLFVQDKEIMKTFSEKLSHLKSIVENLTIYKDDVEPQYLSIQSRINDQIEEMYLKSEECISNIDEFSRYLQNFQFANEYCPTLRVNIKGKISNLLKQYKNNAKGNTSKITFLANRLKESGPEGANLVSEFKDFEGVERALWNQKVQRFGIVEVIKQLKGHNIDPKILQSRYNTFNKKYEELVTYALNSAASTNQIDTKTIISNIKALTNAQQKTDQMWTQIEANKLPDILAYIFALWTLSSADHYFDADGSEEERKYYLKTPHAVQVVSIFRILGIGYSKFEEKPDHYINILRKQWNKWLGSEKDRVIADNLVQIKTGEGKSITLAVVSTIFALFGFEVRVACYSEYLSKRDYAAFEDLFKALNIQDSIKYETFNQSCEAYINKDGKIRDIYRSKILKGEARAKGDDDKKAKDKARVLLIDEVDVFFRKDFYGAQYRPQATISHPFVTQLIDYIWINRENEQLMSIASIKSTDIYKQCSNIFELDFAPLLEEAVKDMICDAQDFHLHDYVVENNQIGYKDQDKISFDISYGYKTTFAYYQQHSEGCIGYEKLQEQKTIGINCGEFSYAEIPKYFSMILGVTGTLEQLSAPELEILKQVYNIINFTYSPSVYGSSQLLWEPKENVLIVQEDKYYMEIITEINKKMKDNSRAVIVFFNNDENIQNFLHSSLFKEQSYSSKQILNERLNFQEKEDAIKQASRKGQLTLATRTFGRGADFICKDSKVEEAGGVHIILTFFSNEVSEEAQLMGRTARQGNPGSISMILLLQDLSEFNFMLEDLNKCTRSQYYDTLHQFRINLQKTIQSNETISLVQKIKSHNEASQMSKLALEDGNNNQIYEYLKNINLGRSKAKVTKTLIMMDATGSMSSLINKTKNAVSTMFEDASKILTSKDIDPKLFEIQFGCYRNYNSEIQNILQYSSWESNPQNLKKFMESVYARDGWGDEAVEIGLWHANQIAESKEGENLSQVFIIGDAPPNTEQMIDFKRNLKRKELSKSKFSQKTHYMIEIQKLKLKNIPVFTFFVDKQAKKEFEEIANVTGGTCQYLDVNSEDGQNMLIKLFVTQILERVGDQNGGRGKEIVEAYKAYKQ